MITRVDHAARTDLEDICVLVSTHDRSVEDAARDVLTTVGWVGAAV